MKFEERIILNLIKLEKKNIEESEYNKDIIKERVKARIESMINSPENNDKTVNELTEILDNYDSMFDLAYNPLIPQEIIQRVQQGQARDIEKAEEMKKGFEEKRQKWISSINQTINDNKTLEENKDDEARKSEETNKDAEIKDDGLENIPMKGKEKVFHDKKEDSSKKKSKPKEIEVAGVFEQTKIDEQTRTKIIELAKEADKDKTEDEDSGKDYR